MREWDQTIVAKPGDDREELFEMMMRSMVERLQREGRTIIKTEKTILDAVVSQGILDPGDVILAVYAATDH